MVKTMLYKRTIALGISIDFGKDLRRAERRGDSGGSGWRKEAVKTGGRIRNITEKNAERDPDVRWGRSLCDSNALSHLI